MSPHEYHPNPNPQVKFIAPAQKPRDITSMRAQGLWVDYQVLAKGSYLLME